MRDRRKIKLHQVRSQGPCRSQIDMVLWYVSSKTQPAFNIHTLGSKNWKHLANIFINAVAIHIVDANGIQIEVNAVLITQEIWLTEFPIEHN